MENEVDFLRTEELPVETGQVFTPEIKAEIGHTRKYMLETLAMLAAPIIMAWYFYGGPCRLFGTFRRL